jgi:hypothetical protein
MSGTGFADVSPQGELREVLPGVWWLRGSVRMGPGVLVPRAMVVLRHGTELAVLNAVRPDEANRAALDALGRVAHVVKLGTHGMDDAWFVHTYGARRWLLPGVPADGPIEPLREDHLPLPDLRLFTFRGTKDPEAALIAPIDGGVLLTCDSVQSWPDLEGCSLLAKPISIALGFTARPVVIGPPWRKRMTPPGSSLRPDFERLLGEPFRHLIGAHGKPFLGTAHEALRATVDATFPR